MDQFWFDPDFTGWHVFADNYGTSPLKPGTVVPGKYGVDWGFVQPGAGSARWRCAYCGGLRASDTVRCVGCGAER